MGLGVCLHQSVKTPTSVRDQSKPEPSVSRSGFGRRSDRASERRFQKGSSLQRYEIRDDNTALIGKDFCYLPCGSIIDQYQQCGIPVFNSSSLYVIFKDFLKLLYSFTIQQISSRISLNSSSSAVLLSSLVPRPDLFPE